MRRVAFGFFLFSIAIISIMMGGTVLAVIMGAASLVGGDEFVAMAKAKGMRPSGNIVRFMIFSFFVVAALPSIPALHLNDRFSLEHFPILLTIGICVSFTRLLFRQENPPATIADIATTILGFIYVGFLPSHLVLLRNLTPEGMEVTHNVLKQPGLAYVWVALFIIWATDVFAYYVGKKMGKRLLYPQISPKKTVEGAIGGLLASMFWATVVVYCADHYIFACHPFKFKLWQAPLMGAAVSIASQLGDLCESLIKRDAGVKDSSNILPGHGGILDRGDSMIVGGAISYYWVYIVVLGIL